ncbi:MULTISPECIES: MFS transporter [Paenibacillus]|uniref:MFS transporter n=1 Tax=Paenibacillus TaxID=44249 RepID=UPI000B15C019|nr:MULTISPECIES: MFS transporter [Paenibacillus]MDU4697250.1 MFS transporter [Paenibacillus sp.]
MNLETSQMEDGAASLTAEPSPKPTTRNPLAGFAEPFRKSNAFPYLWLGQLVSFLGSSVTLVILPIIVYSLTGSTTTMGLLMAAYMLPNIIMLPISGTLVDRYNRTNLMLLTDMLRFAVMATLAVLLFADALTIQLLFILVTSYGLMDGLFQPAYAATRATVFTPDIRNSANALTQISNQTVRLIGPSLGGVLVTFFSAGWGVALDALTYVASFLCLFGLRKLVPHRPRAADESAGMRADFKEGFAVLKAKPWLWITIVAFSLVNICFGAIVTVVIPWLFKIHLDLQPYVYGLAVTCSGVGAIGAGVLFGAKRHWRHRGVIAYGGALLSGISLLLMATAPAPAVLCALFALEGFGLMMFGLIWETSLQELVPQETFGRVASLDMLGSFALLPIGYILVGWLADVIGGLQTIALFASIGTLAVLAVMFTPAVRNYD